MQSPKQKSRFSRSPTLETVLMVEKTIDKYSGTYNRTQLWKKLPRKVMWQTYLVVLDYLESSGKIMADKEGVMIWTYDPEGIKKILSKGIKLR